MAQRREKIRLGISAAFSLSMPFRTLYGAAYVYPFISFFLEGLCRRFPSVALYQLRMSQKPRQCR